MKALRLAVPPGEARAAGRAVARRLLALPPLAGPGRVAVYAALPGELPTRDLFDGLRGRGQAPLLPRCVGDRLEFAPIDRFEELASGRYGVPEPPGPALALGVGDVVVVPGLAFDGEGRRLGRGGGFYDRTFPAGDAGGPLLVGVGFDFQRVESVPAGRRDRAVDVVVTERGIVGTP